MLWERRIRSLYNFTPVEVPTDAVLIPVMF